MMDTENAPKKSTSQSPLIISLVFLVVLLLVGFFLYKAAKRTQTAMVYKQAVVVTPTTAMQPTSSTAMQNAVTTDPQLDTTAAENSLNKLDSELSSTDNHLSNQNQDIPQ